ncbi:MAG: hypothetical protein KDB27_23130 [Planctomycetales bacterium]|nr:hypothetical protein [Planctomycetales bacterium]
MIQFQFNTTIAHKLSKRIALVSIAMLSLITSAAPADTQTIFTDADTYNAVICRNDAPFNFWCDGGRGTQQYVKVHDQNALFSGYWHFDLSQIDAQSPIEEARLQLDTQTNSYGETTVSVFAIADSDADWDLDAFPESRLNGINAPFSDYESYAWTGNPGIDGQQRFNSPTPFLEEGTDSGARVRLLEEGIVHENQDPNADEDGNSFGGHVNQNVITGPGEPGAADGDTNAWPVKNAIDIDITDLVKWKLGQNPSYSDFEPGDRELTIMIRTDFQESGDPNGFVRYVSKESWLYRRSIGDVQLEPARIVLNSSSGIGADLNGDGVIDASDIDLLYSNLGLQNQAYDLSGDGNVDRADLDVLVNKELNTYYGDANLDGEFNSSDLVDVFQANKFEQDIDATWAEGDWTGDRRFDSGDFVVAFADGGFEKGQRAAVNAVPEPSSTVLLGVAMLLLSRFRLTASRA